MQDAERIFDLLPVGIVRIHDRVVVNSNAVFVEMFEYSREEVIGMSLETLYPSYEYFLARGEEWRRHFCSLGRYCDELIMVCKSGRSMRMRVSGRCEDRQHPTDYVVCTFEALQRLPERLELSPRERQIVAAMGQGLTSKQIARTLNLTHRTVETYRSRLLVKTGARNTAQLLGCHPGAMVQPASPAKELAAVD